MIASDKQVVHMYVNAHLPLAGGLIKQTTTCICCLGVVGHSAFEAWLNM